ncbi:MAG: hypothetical protein JSR48_00795 [Verrucomicrobia bacterium]|nr:hypothetical protein [Verrucomicrobiota bacterium]
MNNVHIVMAWKAHGAPTDEEDAEMTKIEFDGFAVYQIGCAIFGVGLDADSARADAAEWIGGEEEAMAVPEYTPRTFADGDTVVVQCSTALVEQVEHEGGADGFRETRDEAGRLALCTVEEAESSVA